ncbi:MAG TPA: MBL fold metallo-hydrolase [Bryobacteraceae bacterium]|nr:MBL fold metallo-hydrolase [Bryobacteraceae bacterium]
MTDPSGRKLTRRQTFQGVLAASALFDWHAAAQPAAIPFWNTELRQLAPGIFAYVQAGGPGVPSLSVSNAGLILGDRTMIAIDALGAPLHAQAFIAAAKNAAPQKSFERLILTHHHLDHIEGNQYFLPAEIVGHVYCRQAILETKLPSAVWQKRDGWALGGEARKLIPPDVTFTDKLTYFYSGRVVELIFNAPAHTWGDAMIYLPEHKILFAGDLAFHYVAPFAHNGHVTKWLQAIDRILGMDVDTIVPGHGPIGGKKDLAQMGQYLATFKREARKRFDAGLSPGQAAADISLGSFDQWIGAPDRMVMNTVRLYHEFDNTIVPEADTEGMRLATIEYNAIRSKK